MKIAIDRSPWKHKAISRISEKVHSHERVIIQKRLLNYVKFPSFLIVQHWYFLFFGFDEQHQSK